MRPCAREAVDLPGEAANAFVRVDKVDLVIELLQKSNVSRLEACGQTVRDFFIGIC